MIEYMFDHLRLETRGRHLIMIIYTLTESEGKMAFVFTEAKD